MCRSYPEYDHAITNRKPRDISSMVKYPPVNRCIYCYQTPEEIGRLTDEHIIAESLGGDKILPASSCRSCAKLTSQFERNFARGMYGPLRVRRGFPSKRNHRNAGTKLIYRKIEGKFVAEEIPLGEYPGHYLAAQLPLPALIDGRGDGHTNPEFEIAIKGDSSEINAIKNREDSIKIVTNFDMGAFTKTIAKTAHAYTVASLGFSGYIPLLPAIIFGRERKVFDLIGGCGPETIHHDCDLAILVQLISNEPFLVVALNLMGSDANARPRLPTYLAVAGKITDQSCFHHINRR